jgi:hypothetical protein
MKRKRGYRKAGEAFALGWRLEKPNSWFTSKNKSSLLPRSGFVQRARNRVLWPDCRHDGCERSEDADGGIKPAIASLALLFAFWAPLVSCLTTRSSVFVFGGGFFSWLCGTVFFLFLRRFYAVAHDVRRHFLIVFFYVFIRFIE